MNYKENIEGTTVNVWYNNLTEMREKLYGSLIKVIITVSNDFFTSKLKRYFVMI